MKNFIFNAYSATKTYANKHKFHFFTICLFGLLGFAFSGQLAYIKKLESDIRDLDKSKNEMISQLEKSLRVQDATIEETLTKSMDKRVTALNSRLDIMDSSIQPDEKRRMLIKTVRDAIKDNTSQSLSVRTLNRIAIAVVDNAYKYDLSIAAVLAQMKQESNFDVNAQSHAGARGLMQIIAPTADEIAHELNRTRYNIWNIETNIEFGCYYMSKMLHVFENNYQDALRAYNFGPHNVKKVKAGEADYSNSILIDKDGVELHVLIDKRGQPLLDDNNKLIIVEEEHKYPLETRDYVVYIKRNREIFSEYGLDKNE